MSEFYASIPISVKQSRSAVVVQFERRRRPSELWYGIIGGMEKKKPQHLGEESKPIKVPRLAHKRYEKANELKDRRKKKREDFSQTAARIVREATERTEVPAQIKSPTKSAADKTSRR